MSKILKVLNVVVLMIFVSLIISNFQPAPKAESEPQFGLPTKFKQTLLAYKGKDIIINQNEKKDTFPNKIMEVGDDYVMLQSSIGARLVGQLAALPFTSIYVAYQGTDGKLHIVTR